MKAFKKAALAVAIGVAIIGFASNAQAKLTSAQAKQGQVFLNTYSKIAYLTYKDSLADAKKLKAAVDAFVAKPTQLNFERAKKAWLASRESYGQSEIFRLSQGPIDAEEGWVEKLYGNLEGQINAWPLDENMIDYTVGPDGKTTGHNIIQGSGDYTPGGENATAVNIDKITPDVLAELNENGGEANVASGYHAIEFLLWGQDQDYDNFLEDSVTHGAMTAGQRPLTDFTTDKYAKRRLQYLQAATNKLVADLDTVTSAWGEHGTFRLALERKLTGKDAAKNLDTEESLRNIFIGMGMFLKSELANERIAVAVLTPSEEDEHSCFSDNTHRDIDTNFQGFVNVYQGTYKGQKIGPSIAQALGTGTTSQKVSELVADIQGHIKHVNHLATTSAHFDYQIRPDHKEARKNIISLKNELRNLGDEMVAVATNYGVSLSTDDVTDPEENHDYEK